MTIGIAKSTLKIPPRHNSIVPIKIKGHSITGHVACFISNQESTKGKDPNINIVNSIHNIKGKTSVNILVSNYSNKHVRFNKEEYVGHLEPTIENIDEERFYTFMKIQMPIPQAVLQQKIMSEQVEPDAFEPPCQNSNQTLRPDLKHY